MSNPLRYLWWDDFRYAYRANAMRLALYAGSNLYAPILTVAGLPSGQFTNAPLWSGDGETTVTFADTAAGRGEQFANAYLHAMRILLGGQLDGSVPFCVFPNGWGYAVGDLNDPANDSTDWITDRATYERLSRHDDDLLPATYLGETVLPRQRGASGYAENGIAANYAWWVDFFTAAKAYIDTALGHSLTPLEVYDDCETQGPNMSTFLSRINATELVHRTIDVIQADARWSTELVNGTQTWADFYATLDAGEQAQLENAANTSVFADALTLVAEKLTVFRDTCHLWQIDQSLGRAAREVWGSRLRFICEYGIQPESSAVGTLNDRTSALLADRMFESRGPLVLPTGWGAAPVSYQLYGLRDSATLGNMSILAAVGGYASTGNRDEDGRLFNKFRIVENVRRIRALGAEVVPWMTYNRYAGASTGIVVADDMNADDHLEVLDSLVENGLDRFIYWGNPGLSDWETDFAPFIDNILPQLSIPRQADISAKVGVGRLRRRRRRRRTRR